MMEPEAQSQQAPAQDDGIQDVVWRVLDEPVVTTSSSNPEAGKAEADHNNGHLLVALATAERQLAEAKHQIAQLESLMEELPAIFERKFKQRLQPVMERQEQLLSDNKELQQQIRRLAPAPGEVRLRFNPEPSTPQPEAAIRLPQLPAQARQVRNPDGERGRRRRAA